MRKHEIPREAKGEGRILIFFNLQSIITTVIGLVIGLILGSIVSMFAGKVGFIVMLAAFGILGFIVGAVKIPEIKTMPITKSVNGLYLHQVVIRYIKFKQRRSLKTLKREEYFNGNSSYN